MIKAAIHLLVVCVVVTLLNVVYYGAYSYPKYAIPQFLPLPYIPIIVIITLIVSFFYGTKIIGVKGKFAIIFAIFVVSLFLILTNYIDRNFDYVIKHYYNSGNGYRDLFSIGEYRNQKGNYLTVRSKLRKEGIKVNHIVHGNTDNLNWDRVSETYTKGIYYVNNELYIIFDWNVKEISKLVRNEELGQHLIEKENIKNIERITYTRYSIIIDSVDYTIYPNSDNEFDFIIE